MSWIGDFFAKLFGNSSEQPITRTTPKKSSPPQTHHRTPTSSGNLGWLINQQQGPHKRISYDLSNPPKIEQQVLSGLRHRIHEIPPMPEIWRRIQNILEQPDASAADLGLCIAEDPVLTAHIFKICNSSAYATAGSSQISSIALAIARLGLDETSNILFQMLVPDLGSNDYKRKQVRHIWMHSQAISALMRILAEPCHQLSRNEASLIGMLHDIGKLVILHLEDETKLMQLKEAIDSGTASLEAEFDILGYTHIDAGSMLALHWQLPRQIQHRIAMHHHPDNLPRINIEAETQHLMMALNLSHMIYQHFLFGDDNSQGSDIWFQHRRQFAERAESFIKLELELPLDSQIQYQQLQLQMERIKLTFPDLFTENEESDN